MDLRLGLHRSQEWTSSWERVSRKSRPPPGHFREEFQTEEGEALRDDEKYAYVAAWEFKAQNQFELHKEELKYENIKIAQRSYK